MHEVKWWFGFRQISPEPAGQAIACGPYKSFGEAQAEIERSKAWDCEVSTPYPAGSEQEAEEKANKYLS